MGDILRPNFGKKPSDPEKAESTQSDSASSEETVSKYDDAVNQASMITKVLSGQHVNSKIYQSTIMANRASSIEEIAKIIEAASKDGVLKKPAYYKAINDIFLDTYTEWLKQFK